MPSQIKKIRQKFTEKLKQRSFCSNVLELRRDPIQSTLVPDQTQRAMITGSSTNNFTTMCRIMLLQYFRYEEPIHSLAKRWLDFDQDVDTRREIEDLLQREEKLALEACMRNRIQFGTAGLRAKMGAGFAYMNPLIVVQTSQGLAEYILRETKDAKTMGVVIGYDTRHNSEGFAKHAASVFRKKGIKVYWFGQYVPTPFVSFAVKHLRAAAGVMITASHNPAQDNGYKVYWSNGAQINTPHDLGISKCIMSNQKPETWIDTATELGSGSVENVYIKIHGAYIAAVKKFAFKRARITELSQVSSLTKDIDQFIYTPLHGVGYRFFERLAVSIGFFDHMTVVETQKDPDPDFSTLTFPNPEEPAALDLAIKLAEEKGVKFIIANDPDADRLALAERVGDRWHRFTGDQIGLLLAEYLRYTSAEASTIGVYMLTSAVSSRMLFRMETSDTGTANGKPNFMAQETLTGFKWLGNKAYDIINDNSQASVPFAYEEALGFMFPEISFDKDGLSAATVLLLAMAEWKRGGQTPYDKLQELSKRYGYSETLNMSFRLDKEATDTAFKKIRDFVNDQIIKSLDKAFALGEYKVYRVRDVTKGTDWTGLGNVRFSNEEVPVSRGSRIEEARHREPILPSSGRSGNEEVRHLGPIDSFIKRNDNEPVRYQGPLLPVSKDMQMITFCLDTKNPQEGDWIRFTLRASGTEPKVKLYLECCAEGSERAEVIAKDVLEVIVNDLLRSRGFAKCFESNLVGVNVVTSFGHKFPFPSERILQQAKKPWFRPRLQ